MKHKSKSVGYMLAFFLGGLGAHAFYYKKYIRGTLYLLFCWTYIPVCLGWFDMFFIKKWHKQLEDNRDISSNAELSPTLSEVIEQEVTQAIKPVIDNARNNLIFYNEEDIVLPKYRHLQTSKEILADIERIKHPKREVHSRNGISIEVTFSHSRESFVQDSLRYAGESGGICQEVPLQAYWMTFDMLNSKQRDWYFYWRDQVLKGNYIEVDLSYVFLYTYELLNYSFNPNASFNVSMLVRLYENYVERLPKLERYLKQWIADMLYELGEQALAEEWSVERGDIPPLYNQLKEKADQLSKISITSWKPYVRNYRETVFYKEHKNKVFKIFKESIPLLQRIYKEERNDLISRWFQTKKEREIRRLFSSAVVGRSYNEIHIGVERIRPTEELYNEVTALFRLFENVARILNGEKREIKVEEGFLPEGFKNMMMEHFSRAAKETNKRFKVVQNAEYQEKDGEIPLPPQETVENQVESTKPTIEFNVEKIIQLQNETDELINTIDSRNETEDELIKGVMESETKEAVRLDTECDLDVQVIAEKDESSLETNLLSALGGNSDVEGEDEFIESLTDIEIEFLSRFENGQYRHEEAIQFLKQRGIMIGMFLNELNEKANEYLGDNFLENQGDEIVVYEEYEHIMEKVKELQVHEY
ncbi:TerB N-terminal domain-containing protein [Bacillus thuringiensis]|uniref:TerB N-terminal domain-containing protein n=1 Tax=Bacillus thuringiensis TaxID=1428 RepID=UPI003D07AFF9